MNDIRLGVAEHLLDISKRRRDAMRGRKRLRSGLVEIAACDERRVVNGPDGLGMHMGDAATADERDAEASGLSSANLATIAQGITNSKRSRHTHERPYPRMRIWRLGRIVFYTGYLDEEPSELFYTEGYIGGATISYTL